jgi:hypothetical protein
MESASETIVRDRCPTRVAVLGGAWLALLAGAGLNAGWLFSALMKAGVQFRQGPAAGIDSEETGRILAGVLAQPAFVVVFLVGMVIGPVSAWMLLRQARDLGPAGRHRRVAAWMLLAAAALGVGQLTLARTIAERAVARTEALVSGDAARATQARAALDQAHRASEAGYVAESALVAVGLMLAARPSRRAAAVPSA